MEAVGSPMQYAGCPLSGLFIIKKKKKTYVLTHCSSYDLNVCKFINNKMDRNENDLKIPFT